MILIQQNYDMFKLFMDNMIYSMSAFLMILGIINWGDSFSIPEMPYSILARIQAQQKSA